MKLTETTKILLWGSNVWFFGEGMLGPLFAIFAQRIGGDILDITWAWAAYLIATGFCYMLVGKLISGRDNTSRVMILGYGLNALFTFGYLFVHNPLQLLIVQVGLGIAEAIGTPSWYELYSRNLDEKHSSYAWGLATGQSHLATGVAIIGGGLIVHYMSFNALFVVMGSIQVIATLVQARILKV